MDINYRPGTERQILHSLPMEIVGGRKEGGDCGGISKSFLCCKCEMVPDLFFFLFSFFFFFSLCFLMGGSFASRNFGGDLWSQAL